MHLNMGQRHGGRGIVARTRVRVFIVKRRDAECRALLGFA